ncbi:helix-turn-helix domain-containing protein [Belliella pelovolcani]|uniref:Helix-turn-helix domain-containing protein n=1 Tax=Belliella pelovolcani TaxID=529505 RepID=A0A1N7PIF2_9BACT|nr:helix-turn-helix domain-containing protein [Belliella pelovolcani]SIT10371.1 Helix-turn-helix domain-containing protein [Belliella pelovolcani]
MIQVDLITKKDLDELRLKIFEDLQKLLSPKKQEVKDWLKSGEVRKILQISAGSLQNLRINGFLNPKKIGGTYYYRKAEIEKLFKE